MGIGGITSLKSCLRLLIVETFGHVATGFLTCSFDGLALFSLEFDEQENISTVLLCISLLLPLIKLSFE